VNAQGAAMCWGLGGAANSLVPVGLNAGAGVAIKFLSSSSTTSGNDTSHSCMITGQDTLKCWGPNFYGAVGDGTVSSRPIPFDVPGLTAIKAVATGGFSTCAIGAQNSVKCWGLNTFAQLGNHTSAFSSVALEVKSLSGTTAAAPGFHHNCAIGAGGTVKCWGDNFFGQLGNNSNVSSVSPVDVIGLTGVKAVVAGDNHSCAINANDTVSCWGSNNFGQLGSAGNPLRIPTSVPGVVGIIALTAGSNHTCALALSGAVTCWGRNNAGQLGNNSNVGSTIPVNVVGITGAKALVTGSEHNCVITAQDTVKCWGLDASNQLGNNDGVALNSLVPTDVFGLTGVKSMASGAAHNCVLTAQNNLKCWGANSFGQLGNRTASMPVDSAVDAVGLTGIKGVALGRGHTCAITAQNTVQCWGSGNFGHLGNNSTQHSLIPQDVVGLKDVKSIAAKEYRTIAISTDGLQTKQFGYLQSNSLVPIDVTVPAPPVP
jgi:alpha-tubulin suppressor-like RCC1 family protein